MGEKLKDIINPENEKEALKLELKKAENKLKNIKNNLNKCIKERTKKLEDLNEKLREEIIEHKKSEEYSNRSKQNLRNIIDSATELIISFDTNNRLSIWNKTCEYVTGYKEIEVLNRSITKLDVFENKEIIINQIKKICEQKKSKLEDIILKTKDNEKRIIRIEGTDIKSLNKECVGALFVGKDITKDIELHNKLLEGNGYLILDKNNKISIDLIIDSTINNYKGLILTRGSPSLINRLIPDPKNVEIILLSKETQKNYNNISDLASIENTINKFINRNKKTVILLDGIHYLISKFSFDELIDTLYNINELIAKNNSIFFIRIDPSTIDKNQMAILENEMQMLPSQKTEDIMIEDFLFDIIKYILEQNQNNAIVSFNKVTAKFKISYVTAALRLDSLEKKGLVFTKKQGKLRAIFITEKGKSLINARKPV